MSNVDMAVMSEKFRRESQMVSQRMGSILPGCVTHDGVVSGDGRRVTFYRTDETERPVQKTGNGRLPARNARNRAFTADLNKFHSPVDIDNFDEFRTSFNLRESLARSSIQSLYRDIDNDIINTMVSSPTQFDGGLATQLGLNTALEWRRLLQERSAMRQGGKTTALITPKAEELLMRIDQFNSSDYVEMKPFSVDGMYVEGSEGSVMARMWYGVKWVAFPGLPGQGTAAAQMVIFPDHAVGHAATPVETKMGEDERDDEYWIRHSSAYGSTLIEEESVIVMTHDDTA